MTDIDYQRALDCWYLAITEYLTLKDQTMSFENLAKIQSEEKDVPYEHLEKVAEWFNWDQVCKDIRP